MQIMIYFCCQVGDSGCNYTLNAKFVRNIFMVENYIILQLRDFKICIKTKWKKL